MADLTFQQRRAFEIAEEAFEHPPGPTRNAAVAAACGEDAALHRAVDALLRADDAAHTLLDGAAFVPSDAPLEAVGAFRVTGELGRGGMGVVYAAERADGAFEQHVAVKVMRDRGPSAARTAARFDQERRLLARLRHPGIVPLLGGGVTDDGRPYVIMEHVDGVPITEACAGLDADARLALFLQVCDAAAHAHRNLIVHRDLKPSNVLVETTEAGALRARLLDFGIAKALDRADDALTQTAAPLTPSCAAPEQVRGGPVTAATDVYALGVMLYEMLTGQRPYAFGERSMAEITRVVLEQTPVRPSAASRTTQLAAGSTATALRPDAVVDPGDAPSPGDAATPPLEPIPASRLRGDLDAIVMQALRKEPERRYATASELGADLRRHLDHRPVLARGDSPGYLVGRFVRRHRAATAGALLVLLAIVGGALAVGFQARQTAQEAARARATLNWVLGTFDAVDPDALDGEAIDARDLVRPGLARIRELDGQPLVQAAVMEGLGRLGLSLGLYPVVDSLLEGSIVLRTQAQGPRHADVAAARLLLAQSLLDQREYARAEALAQEALGAPAVQEDAARHARALGTLADIHRQNGDEDAADLYRRALAVGGAALSESERTELRVALGSTLSYDGSVEEAVGVLEEAAAAAERAHGPRDPRTATAWRALAYAVELVGDPVRSADLLQRALAVSRAAYGEADGRVAQDLYAIGRLRLTGGDAAGAVRDYGAAVRAFEASELASDHLWRAYAVVGLGRALTEAGEPDEAADRLRQGLALYADALAPDDYRVLAAQGYLGAARLAGGDAAGRAALDRSWRGLAVKLDENAYVGATAAPVVRALLADARRRGDAGAARRYAADLAALDAE